MNEKWAVILGLAVVIWELMQEATQKAERVRSLRRENQNQAQEKESLREHVPELVIKERTQFLEVKNQNKAQEIEFLR